MKELLPAFDWPPVPRQLADQARVGAIVEELHLSQSPLLVTLGDLPLKWFASTFGAFGTLREYGATSAEYGRRWPLKIEGHHCELLPLVHPRQAAGLGLASALWKDLHREWLERQTKAASV